MKVSFYGQDQEDFSKIFEKFNLKGDFRSRQLVDHIYRNFVADVEKMTNVSKNVREYLKENYSFELPMVARAFVSNDGTKKFLLKLQDGQFIESVIIPDENRVTLCVSSQVGCAMKCSFCHTGSQGFTRHLRTDEIVGQVILAQQNFDRKLTNIVFMGMGEPLHNFDQVIKAVKILNEYMDFGKRKITVSTSGLVPEIKKLGSMTGVNLAISLHAANDELRNTLVPLNKKYNLASLMKACKEYPLGSHRKITFEYTIIKGVNDAAEHGRELVDLLQGVPALLNIIPMNSHPCSPYQPPEDDKIYKFQKIILDAGIRSTVRKTRGDDILAACGQLKAKATALQEALI